MRFHVKGRISGIHIINEDFDIDVDEIIEADNEHHAFNFAVDNAIDEADKPFGLEETEIHFRRLEIVPLTDTELSDAEIAFRDGEGMMVALGVPTLFEIPGLPSVGAALPGTSEALL